MPHKPRNPYDESSAYGRVNYVPGTESFMHPGQPGSYEQSVTPEYGREPLQETPSISAHQRWLDYMNPPDTVSQEEYDYRTGLRQAQAQEELTIEKSKAESAKAAGLGEEASAKAEALRRGDTTLALIESMPENTRELLRSSYILGKAGLKDQSLYDVLDRLQDAQKKADTERTETQAAAAKANVEQPAYPQRTGSTFLEDILSPLTQGGGPGAAGGELGVGEEQGIEYTPPPTRAPVTRAGQGPSVEQWQRNPKTGKIERVS